MKKILNKQQLEEYLKQGYSVNQISKIINEYPKIIAQNLDYYGIPRPNSRSIKPRVRPDIDKQWLIDNWVNTSYSMRELAERENISEGIIDERRAKYGLVKNSKYTVNISKLFDINDLNVWYLAGLIATDGYLSHDHDSIEISLSGESERKLLEDINSYFESTRPIETYNSARLKITSKGIQKFLNENFNIPLKNKTFDIQVPEKFISEEHAKAYVLGCMDGDGCIMSPDKFSICCGSEKFICGIKDIFVKYVECDIPNVRLESRQNRIIKYPTFRVSGKKANKILNWLYSSNCCLKLERKYLKYKGNDIV